MGYVKRVHNNYLSVCDFRGKNMLEGYILFCRIRGGFIDGGGMAAGEDNLRQKIVGTKEGKWKRVRSA